MYLHCIANKVGGNQVKCYWLYVNVNTQSIIRREQMIYYILLDLLVRTNYIFTVLFVKLILFRFPHTGLYYIQLHRPSYVVFTMKYAGIVTAKWGYA